MNFSQIRRISSLKGRVAIVTGATNCIGHATALHLASLGAFIPLVYSLGASIEADRLAEEINFGSSASIPRAIGIRSDVSDPVDVRHIFNFTEETFKCRPHIVFHSSGILGHYYYSSMSQYKFESIISANARNAFLVLREAANRVTHDVGGRILALSSLLVETNQPGYGAYTASKAAVEAMVKTLTNEFQEKRIRITANCIAPWPGPMNMYFPGKMKEDGKTAAPLRDNIEDIESMVGFLCSDWGKLVNGEVIRVKSTYGRR